MFFTDWHRVTLGPASAIPAPRLITQDHSPNRPKSPYLDFSLPGDFGEMPITSVFTYETGQRNIVYTLLSPQLLPQTSELLVSDREEMVVGCQNVVTVTMMLTHWL